MSKLFCDCKTDEEKSNFFLSGQGVETGIIAPAISNEVAMAFHRCFEFEKQLSEAYEAGKRDAISKWQPIETAPKDGTAFRAYADELIDLDFNPCGSVEAAWSGEEFIGCVWNGQQDAWYGKAINPTHWMPLPAAPKGEEL